uniref:putative uncharacterized protein FLJ44672 n=1 Tax=Callithrix jacchus TaxID=9483 RepID=UPI0023DD051A|nr:putative uncharacterized protein FLJ44672 [Callithrix jacchus]
MARHRFPPISLGRPKHWVLKSASPGPAPTHLVSPPHGLKTSSCGPLQGQLLPPNGPLGPSFGLPSASLGGPTSSSLLAAFPCLDPLPGHVYGPMFCLPEDSFGSAFGQLPAAFCFQPKASLELLGHPFCFSVASTGPATSLQWSLQAQLWPPYRLSSNSHSLLAALPSQDPWSFLCRPKVLSSGAFQASILPPGGLDRPCYLLTLAAPGPALDFPQPPQHQLLPARGFPRPRFCLPACIPAASTGPAPPSHCPIEAQLMPVTNLSRPSFHLTLASSLGPGPPSQWPSSAQLAYHGLSRAAPASWWLLQALSFLSGPGLTRPSSCLCQAPPSPASTFQWTLQTQLVASPWPLLRPSSILWASLYSQACPRPSHGSFGPSWCLPVALPGPALAFWHPLCFQNVFRSASFGPAVSGSPRLSLQEAS